MDTSDAKITIFEYPSAHLSEQYVEEEIDKVGKDIGVQARMLTYRVIEYPTTQDQTRYKYARLTCVVKHPGADPPWPVILWFRWEGSISNWVPDWVVGLYGYHRGQNTQVLY